MTRLTARDRKGLLSAAKDAGLREDARRVAAGRHNPFMAEGKYNLDRYIEFLNEFNGFMGHKRRRFSKIKDKISKI